MELSDKNFSRNSRVILTLGEDNFECLSDFKVAVYGLTAVGSEMIKDLILTNVGYIDVFDDTIVEMKDVGSNFFAKMENIGEKKVDTILNRLKELNTIIHLEASKESISEEILLNYNAFIICKPIPYTILQKYSKFCHKNKICFICAFCLGPLAGVFEDFNEDFVVTNENGRKPFKHAVEKVSAKGMITLSESNDKLKKGTKIRFESCKSCPALNELDLVLEEKPPLSNLYIGKTEEELGSFDRTKSFGFIREVKPETHIWHKELSETLNNQFENSFIRDVFISVCKEMDKNGEFPSKIEGQSERFCAAAPYEYPPIAAAIGSAAAHNAIMYQTHLNMPAENQWILLDFGFALSEEMPKLDGSRYDSVVSTIGNKAFDSFHNSTLLVIGAGAIGCEYARDLALLGPKKIYIYDDDDIEPSNLTRQFLYKEANNGSKKAEVAAAAIRQANKDIEVVGITTLFNVNTARDIDIKQFDAILSGVDTAKGRFFASNIARILEKPFVNCGAQEAFGQGKIIIPHKTSLYVYMGEKRRTDTSDLSCTQKFKPNRTEDCVSLFKNVFDEDFDIIPNHCTEKKNIRNKEEEACLFLEDAPQCFDDCALYARKLFERYHVWDIKGRTKTVVTAVYDPNDKLHAMAIRTCAKLRADCFSIKYTDEDLQNAPTRVPLKIDEEVTEKTVKMSSEWHDRRMSLLEGKEINPCKFNKDDLVHINFVYSMTNIRAKAFNLPFMEKVEVMRIAGDIAPTMATTGTAIGALCMAGLVNAFDKDKIEKEEKVHSSFKVNFMNGEFSIYTNSAPKNKWKPIIIDGEMSTYDFTDKLEDEYNIDILEMNYEYNGVLLQIPEDMKEMPMKEAILKIFREMHKSEPLLDYMPLYFELERAKAIPVFYLKIR